MVMMSDRFVLEEEFEEFGDTKGLIRIRKSKDRQYNDQKVVLTYSYNVLS
jgi:hypothetical protein